STCIGAVTGSTTGGNRLATRCTFTSGANAGTDCTNTPTAAGCTQGLVVAISDADPNATTDSDTLAIANRVAQQTDGTFFGYGGRTAVQGNFALSNFGVRVNTNGFDVATVRTDTYMLSRRLWLQRNGAGTDVGVTNPPTTGGPNQKAAEDN